MFSRLARPTNINAILAARLFPSCAQSFNRCPVRFASGKKPSKEELEKEELERSGEVQLKPTEPSYTDKFNDSLHDVTGRFWKEGPTMPHEADPCPETTRSEIEKKFANLTEEQRAKIAKLGDTILTEDGELSPELFEKVKSETLSSPNSDEHWQKHMLDFRWKGGKPETYEEYVEMAKKQMPEMDDRRRKQGKASDPGESFGPAKNEFDSWRRIYKEEESFARLGLPPRAHYWRDGEMYSPFGTLSKPVQIYSQFSHRIVGCRGGNGTPHEVVWINLGSKYKTMCPECGQMFQLVNFSPEEHEEPGEDLHVCDKTANDGQLKEPQFY